MITIVLGIQMSSCYQNARFSVLTAVFLMIQVFWDVMHVDWQIVSFFALLGPGDSMVILYVGIDELCV
jgi:hypothetical protein